MSAATTTSAPLARPAARDSLRPTMLVRLALAGTRTDTLRVLLTAFSAALATLAMLSALTVLAIPTPAGDPHSADVLAQQYTSALLREPGLRPGVAFALVLLTVPVLALAGQCVRIGAPARDRRLAAIRLAGGTPRQVVSVAATETGAAALLGTFTGLALYALGREVLHRPEAEGRLPLPTDVLPGLGALAAVVLGLPLLATVTAAFMMRRVRVSPLGVTRRAQRRGAPRPWPGILIALGIGAIGVLQPLLRWYETEERTPPEWLLPVLLAVGGLAGMLGVVLGTGWISHATGRLLHRFARRPAPLLAARRLLSDPWNGSRTFAALLACVVFGTGAAAIRSWFIAWEKAKAERQQRVDAATGQNTPRDLAADPFYVETMNLIDKAVTAALIIAIAGLLVALAESIVSRRRAYAALVATGVPRTTLGRALAWQTLTPVIPATVLALTVGTALGRSFGSEATAQGYTAQNSCAGGQAPLCTNNPSGEAIKVPTIIREADWPIETIAVYGLVTLALILLTIGIGRLFLRSSTSVEELRTG